jgi:orotidine-5'-phosphate decarboxylase
MPLSKAARELPTPHFGDALITRVRDLGHPLCVGLDPHLAKIPPLFRKGTMSAAAPDTADAVEDFFNAVIDRLAGKVAIVKPQIAFFEQLGWRGIRCLERLVTRARQNEILVLLDAKRGDIGSTAEGYASAYLDPDAHMQADAITLNPYLGLETLEPFADRAARHGKGLFVLVKTSNPGSGDLQDRKLESGEDVASAVATSLSNLSDRLKGPATGWSSLGTVVGATYPEQSKQIRERLPDTLFLIPGYGHQGASLADTMSGLIPGPKGLEGGIVSTSRAILFSKNANVENAKSWESEFDSTLEAATTALRDAVQRS